MIATQLDKITTLMKRKKVINLMNQRNQLNKFKEKKLLLVFLKILIEIMTGSYLCHKQKTYHQSHLINQTTHKSSLITETIK